MFRLAATLLLVVIASSAIASSFTLFRCQSDAISRTRCCCPSSELPNRHVDRIQGAPCCDTDRIDVETAASTLARASDPLLLAGALPAYEGVAVVAPPALRISIGVDPHHYGGAPIFLMKCVRLV